MTLLAISATFNDTAVSVPSTTFQFILPNGLYFTDTVGFGNAVVTDPRVLMFEDHSCDGHFFYIYTKQNVDPVTVTNIVNDALAASGDLNR